VKNLREDIANIDQVNAELQQRAIANDINAFYVKHIIDHISEVQVISLDQRVEDIITFHYRGCLHEARFYTRDGSCYTITGGVNRTLQYDTPLAAELFKAIFFKARNDFDSLYKEIASE